MSANRGETVFKDPDRFDIKRDTSAHVAFSSGIHFCVGAPLARLETRVLLKVLLQQLQNVTLIDEYEQAIRTSRCFGFSLSKAFTCEFQAQPN